MEARLRLELKGVVELIESLKLHRDYGLVFDIDYDACMSLRLHDGPIGKFGDTAYCNLMLCPTQEGEARWWVSGNWEDDPGFLDVDDVDTETAVLESYRYLRSIRDSRCL